jgi:hypothetical protein
LPAASAPCLPGEQHRTSRREIGSFALDRGSVIPLVGALLVEINDEMIAAERRYVAAFLADLTGDNVELSLLAAPRI